MYRYYRVHMRQFKYTITILYSRTGHLHRFIKNNFYMRFPGTILLHIYGTIRGNMKFKVFCYLYYY